MKEEKTYDNLTDVLNNIPENYKIMEETIDLDVQREYFETTSKLNFTPHKESCTELIEILFRPDSTIDEIKMTLLKLALIDSVEAFRAIEKFNIKPLAELKDWAILSLQQSSMVLQSSLLDEQQVFISTGLGGKNNMLRYYLIFPYNKVDIVSETQSNALKSELSFFINRQKGEIEEIDFLQHFATALILLPLKTDIPELIKAVLYECNQLGDFLTEDVMITNMKKFNHHEIIDILKKI